MWRHQESFYLSYHEPALVIEWQWHTCPFLLDTKPLWHWGKWKSRPTCKRDPWSRHRPIGKCPLYRFEATGQLLHSSVGSNQVGCSCTWQRSLSCETNTGTSKEFPAFNQSWRGCNQTLDQEKDPLASVHYTDMKPLVNSYIQKFQSNPTNQ